MKKIILSAIIFFFAFDVNMVCNAQINVSAHSAIVIDAHSGRVLYEKNAYERRGMASTTKIMTALLALERLNVDDIVTISAVAAGTEGSSIWLSPSERMSVSRKWSFMSLSVKLFERNAL